MAAAQMSDWDLVRILRGELVLKTASPEQALKELQKRSAKSTWRLTSMIRGNPAFLSAVCCLKIEDFILDMIVKCIDKFKPDKKAEFSTFLFTVARREIISGNRKKNTLSNACITPAQDQDNDADDVQQYQIQDKKAPDPLTSLLFEEIVAITRDCARKLKPTDRDFFVLTALFNLGTRDLAELFPGKSEISLRKNKSRALLAFEDIWENYRLAGIEQVREILPAIGQMMLDPDAVKDKKALHAYKAFMSKGSLPAAAALIGKTHEQTRTLVIRFLKELADQAMRKEKKTGAKKRGKKDPVFEEYLSTDEAGTGRFFVSDVICSYMRGPENPVAERIARLEKTLLLVREAFGFAAPDSSCPTLGAALLSKLRKPEDYDAACSKLGLDFPGLQMLLADRAEPDERLWKALSDFLGIPVKKLKTMPRRPPELPVAELRDSPAIDEDYIRKGVLECLSERKTSAKKRKKK